MLFCEKIKIVMVLSVGERKKRERDICGTIFIAFSNQCFILTLFLENLKNLSLTDSAFKICALYHSPLGTKRCNNKGSSKAENSWGKNALIFKSSWAKRRKNFLHIFNFSSPLVSVGALTLISWKLNFGSLSSLHSAFLIKKVKCKK